MAVMSFIAIISNMNPTPCLNSSIHRPALGKDFSNPGIEVSIAYGKAIPRPINIIATVASGNLWVCAQAKAAAKIAKLHGVLSIAARKPMPTAPKYPFCPWDFPEIEAGTVIAKMPNIKSARTTSSNAIAATKAGLLNWSPQLRTVP